MTGNGSITAARETWDGPFDPATYAAANDILEADRQRVRAEVEGVYRQRRRIVAIVAVVWVVASVALALANPNLMLVAEIGWVVIVAWAVFWLMPAIMSRANVEDLYGQYAAQLQKLEAARIPMPKPSCIEDLTAAIDLVSPPEAQ